MFAWDDLRHVLAVHRSGSLVAAARALRVAETTVGRRLAALEVALGARVVERRAGRYRLTATGTALLALAERMEADASAIAAVAINRDRRLEGRVRITAPEVFGGLFLAPRLASLATDNPRLELELIADNRLLDLARGEADLALRLAPPRGGHVVARKLGSLAYGLYASHAYLKAHGDPTPGFAGHAIVISAAPYAQTPDQRWLRGMAAEARVAFRSTSVLASLELARTGLGVASLPCWLAEPDPQLRGIDPALRTHRDVWLVIREPVRRAARVRQVADFLAGIFAVS